MFAGVDAFTRGFDTNEAGCGMFDIGVKNAHGITAATYAGNHGIRLVILTTCHFQHLRHLHQAFLADHALEVAHHHGVGVRARHGTDDVKSIVDIGHPVAHGFIQRVFQGFAATGHWHHRGTQQFHAVDVGALAFDVLAAHVNHTFQAVTRADGGCGHAVLACAGFGNHAGLAHAFGQHGLPDGVVDFVGAGVVQVLTL